MAGNVAETPESRPDGCRAPEAGFSLMEICVGIAVLSIALMGLGRAMITSYRVERIAQEKQIALVWATSQIEVIRSMSYSEFQNAPSVAPLPGYLIKTAWVNPGSVGKRVDVDADGDEDYFERYFYAPGQANYTSGPDTVVLADQSLLGLRPQTGVTRIGTVTFSEPSSAISGIGEGTGYWVTVLCKWKGIAGDAQVKLTTFVGK